MAAFLVALFSAACHVVASASANSYVLILKDGSTVVGVPEIASDMDAPAGKTIKFKTSFGDITIPGDQIVKFFRQETPAQSANPSEAVKAAKETAEVQTAAQPEVAASKQESPATKEANINKPKKISEAADPEKTPVSDDPLMEISDEKPLPDKKKTPSKADDLLEADDEKLMDMLENKSTDASAVEVNKEAADTSEIQSIKDKYQAKKGIEPKHLVPKNLSSLKDDVKSIAGSASEEDLLLNSTAEIKVKFGDTKPVEIIKVGDGAGASGGGAKEGKDEKKKNDKKDKNKKDKKDKKKGKGSDGKGADTSEASLGTAEVSITNETEEIESLGGDKLSEKITKEFVKHKAHPSRSVSTQEQLDKEIESHFEKTGDTGTAEVEASPAPKEEDAKGKKK